MTKYISSTETAKLIRKALKENFAGTKFSVRKSSGGSSIYVTWTDGPSETSVEKVAKFFEGATFDGMIDLKSYVTIEIDGEEVQFGADYVICQRGMSRTFVETIVQQYEQRFGKCGFVIAGDEQNAYIQYDYRLCSELHWIKEILTNTDAKDMNRAYEAKEEQDAREREAKEQAKKEEQERKEREVREQKAREERRQREEQERQRREQEQARSRQRVTIATKQQALTYLGLSLTADRVAIIKAFREKVRTASDGKGGYSGDMDLLVKAKEKALG